MLVSAPPTQASSAAGASNAKKAQRKIGPPKLRFYTPPKQLPKQHGRLIWQRKTGKKPLTAAAGTRRVLYTSKTLAGKITAVSGTVSFPRGKPPAGGWPVITYAHGTTGIANKCAPSRNLFAGPALTYVNYVYPEINDWLRAGYAVLQTDYQGLGTPGTHPYLVGVPEGRSVLDIVRASRGFRFFPKLSNRYLIAGHSQGGHAALFAAGLAASWTPEIKLRGTVAYAPASQLKEQAQLLQLLTNPSPASGLAGLIIRGMSVDYSQIQPSQLLSDPALALFPQTLSQCIPYLIRPVSLGGLAPAALIRSGADMNPLYNVLGKQNPAVKTAAPIFLAQGTADTTVIPSFTTQLDGQLTALNDKVDYKTYQGATHSGVIPAAETDVMSFFAQRLPSPGNKP
ncbi:MAG: alpha/beta fold hydrolase [Solirubrobacterales bacterium]|nr:alpha/beta fold hydrolase [Solirubrobacterales bacterium]